LGSKNSPRRPERARFAANPRGAVISLGTVCLGGERRDEVWVLTLKSEVTGERVKIKARAVVNAAGPWVGEVLTSTLRGNAPASVALVKGSHIVVPRLYEHDRCYFSRTPIVESFSPSR